MESLPISMEAVARYFIFLVMLPVAVSIVLSVGTAISFYPAYAGTSVAVRATAAGVKVKERVS